MNNYIFSKICCCFNKKEIKKEVKKIRKDADELDKILDLEIMIKNNETFKFFPRNSAG